MELGHEGKGSHDPILRRTYDHQWLFLKARQQGKPLLKFPQPKARQRSWFENEKDSLNFSWLFDEARQMEIFIHKIVGIARLQDIMNWQVWKRFWLLRYWVAGFHKDFGHFHTVFWNTSDVINWFYFESIHMLLKIQKMELRAPWRFSSFVPAIFLPEMGYT